MAEFIVQLNEKERSILDTVAEHQLSHIDPMTINELLLEFPVELGQATRVLVEGLVLKKLIVATGGPNVPNYVLSALGILNASKAGDVALFAENLLNYLRARMQREKGQFKKYTWDELIENRIAKGNEDFVPALQIVPLFNLCAGGSHSFGPPHTAVWNVPFDIADIRSIEDIGGLYDRVQAAEQQRLSQSSTNSTPSTSANSSSQVGHFGPWIRGRKLGSGGQGTTYLAMNEQTGEIGTLKLIHHQKEVSDSAATKARTRFAHELSAIRSIAHPCVLRVLDSDLEANEPWFVTEYFPLGSLHAAFKAIRGDAWRTLRLARDVACALVEAHGEDIIHRDVKPHNILLRTMEHAVLGDFGIAHISDATELTATNEVVGARWYRPPEAESGRIEPSANFDVYSLGKVIYVCLSGGSKFGFGGFRAHSDNVSMIFGRPELEAVNRLLDDMIVEEPTKRIQTMAEVVRRIDATIAELFGGGTSDSCRMCHSGIYAPSQGNVRADTAPVTVRDGHDNVAPLVEICPQCGDIRLTIREKRRAWLARQIRSAK